MTDSWPHHGGSWRLAAADDSRELLVSPASPLSRRIQNPPTVRGRYPPARTRPDLTDPAIVPLTGRPSRRVRVQPTPNQI